MTLVIDTGTQEELTRPMRFGRLDSIGWDILESLPLDATQAQIDGAIAQVVMGDLRTPKRLDTVRRHLVALWPMIAPLALSSPASFDEIMSEYAERVSDLT